MNHLKYIPRISVPRHTPVGAVSLSRQHADMYLEKPTLRFQTVDPISPSKVSHGVKCRKQFHRNLRLVSKESKPIHKPQSARSSLTSLNKQSSVNSRKLPLRKIVKSVCHYSTCKNVKFDGSGINNRHTLQSDSIRKDANVINRRNSVVASIGERPRSYAEMIADYSEILKSSARSDNLYLNNGIRKSPFSTVSTPPLTKVSRVVKRSKISNKRLNDDSIPSAYARESFDLRHRDVNKNIDQECVATKSDDRSYAKLIADCSKHMRNMSLSNVTNSGLMLKSNVLSRNSRKSFEITPTRNVSSTNVQEPSSAVSRAAITGEETDDYWTKEIQNVTNDLNAAVFERKTAKNEKFHKARENDIPESDFAKLQDRINKLSEIIEARKQKNTTVREANLRDHNTSYDTKTSDSKAAMPAGASATTSSSTKKKNFTHVPSGDNAGALKQPQMKLRMVPSEKESLVSINVDSVSGLSDSLDSATKQLSVVVQSDQQRDSQSAENQRTHKPTLQQQSVKSASQRGPMRISISENSAPIKQIEFSINGKPVSELKSITARTEKLDVVSSMDKIEIRIPFAKDDGASAPSNIREESVFAKETDLSGGQILNVQISANFQNEVTKSRIGQTTEKVNTIPPSPLNTSKINYVFKSDESITRPSSSKEKQIPKSEKVEEKVEMKTTKSTVHSPETKKDNTIESDSRFPSKMIPWWSSSDSFKKMKKKDEDTLSKKKKTFLNLKSPRNLIAKSKKSKEIPKSFTSKIQSTNNANCSSNPIFSPRCTDYLSESKPVSYYPSSFRVKPNQENSAIISKKRVLQAEENLEEDDKNNFEIEQIKPIADTNRRLSIKERKSILRRRHKTPGNAKDFSLPENREKKRQYSLKQNLLSIEDVSNTKVGIKNIQNTVKSTEKKQDTWLGSKLRAKSIERSNNDELISNRPAEKMGETSQMEQNVTAKVKTQNRINVNNIPYTRKNDAAALNSPNFKSSSNVKPTTLTKQEKLAANVIVPRDKFKPQTSKTLSKESSKINSPIKTSSKAVENSAKSRNKVTSANKLSSSSRKQTSASSKNETPVTEIPISANKVNKTTNVTDKVVSQNHPERRYLMSKNEKHLLSGNSKGNVSRSVSFPRRPTSDSLLSSRSKMQIESTEGQHAFEVTVSHI
ncbi:uncharacterized protein LOC109852275 [Pseudomyrmex gracilis]|uniref:uncharacterized protein LOC109852275 n=1 Tax=Pseudomyrmex gracilis TaxID=219809 RepID=UPI000995518A|nr:uncharacterized protein LOC109852275 [Pseudomyrmex gracilis]